MLLKYSDKWSEIKVGDNIQVAWTEPERRRSGVRVQTRNIHVTSIDTVTGGEAVMVVKIHGKRALTPNMVSSHEITIVPADCVGFGWLS